MTEATPRTVLVTGASRGLGRGIARHFGCTGATVYITGRAASEAALRDAAAEIDAGGGTGIAVALDQRDADGVAALMTRIDAERGGLDILVNNAAAVHPQLAAPGPFWEKPLDLSDMIEVGLRTNYIAAYYAAKLMVARGRGLIANISFYGAATYFHGPAYGAAKAGTDKMTSDMAYDLRSYGVACVAIWPGFIYSDALAGFVATAPKEHIPPALAEALPLFERPEFTGMVIDALAGDPALMELSGQALIGAEMGTRYGLVDLDGKRPRAFRDTMGGPTRFLPPDPTRPLGIN